MCAGLRYHLATIVVAVVTEVEEVTVAVIPIAVLEVEEPVTIDFVGLRGALEANKCQQAKTGRAHEREKLRAHGQLLSGRGERGEGLSDPLTRTMGWAAPVSR